MTALLERCHCSLKARYSRPQAFLRSTRCSLASREFQEKRALREVLGVTEKTAEMVHRVALVLKAIEAALEFKGLQAP
jgi:hypothetical protein